MTDHFARQHPVMTWTPYIIAAIGIFILASVCLVKRASEYDHEQMSVTTAWYWELNGAKE